MHFIFHKVVELEHHHYANRNRIVVRSPCFSITQNLFTKDRHGVTGAAGVLFSLVANRFTLIGNDRLSLARQPQLQTRVYCMLIGHPNMGCTCRNIFKIKNLVRVKAFLLQPDP